jgi:hypothetical protein
MNDINPLRSILDDMRARITEIDDFLELGIYLRNFNRELEEIGAGLKKFDKDDTSSGDGYKAIKSGISRLNINTLVDMRGMIQAERFLLQDKTPMAQEIVNTIQTLDSLLLNLCDKTKDCEVKGMHDCYDEIVQKTLEQRNIVHTRARMLVHKLIEFVSRLANLLNNIGV